MTLWGTKIFVDGNEPRGRAPDSPLAPLEVLASTAVLGGLVLIWRRRSLTSWVIPIGFVAAYAYVLASYRVVFGRYALPLLPRICLLAAVWSSSIRRTRPKISAFAAVVGSGIRCVPSTSRYTSSCRRSSISASRCRRTARCTRCRARDPIRDTAVPPSTPPCVN